MKKSFLFALLLLSAVMFGLTACDDDDPRNEYYVRYTVGGNPGDDFFVSYGTPNGYAIKQQVCSEGKVETVVGPVNVGFKATLSASVNNGHAPHYLQIDVSCNGKPFVQKLHVRDGVNVFYTITGLDR